jgi:peroxiredoxin family protein
MLPRGTGQLKLSKLNMFGMGPQLMRHIMKKKNIDSLETLMEHALHAGVKIIACQMSMDVMGIKKEELIDGISIGGVATYIEATESATTNLFI